jgi:hypothetical protein
VYEYKNGTEPDSSDPLAVFDVSETGMCKEHHVGTIR